VIGKRGRSRERELASPAGEHIAASATSGIDGSRCRDEARAADMIRWGQQAIAAAAGGAHQGGDLALRTLKSDDSVDPAKRGPDLSTNR
jgi:hypothetical protein